MKPYLQITLLIATFLIPGTAPAEPPPKIEAASPAALEEKAKATIIPKLELKEVSSTEALMTISTSTGIKIAYQPDPADQARITISLTKIPAHEALKYVTSLANLKFRYEKDGVRVVAAGGESPKAK